MKSSYERSVDNLIIAIVLITMATLALAFVIAAS